MDGFTAVKGQATLTVGGRLGLDFHLKLGRADTVVQIEEVATSVNTEPQTDSIDCRPSRAIHMP